MRSDSSRNADTFTRREFFSDFAYIAGDIKPASERIHLPLKQLLELLAADRKKFVFFHRHLDQTRKCATRFARATTSQSGGLRLLCGRTPRPQNDISVYSFRVLPFELPVSLVDNDVPIGFSSRDHRHDVFGKRRHHIEDVTLV